MADDVASLVLAVDSSQVKTGVDNLRLMEAGAKRAGISVDEYRARVIAASTASKQQATATQQVNVETAKQTQATALASAELKKFESGMNSFGSATDKATNQGLSQRAMFRLIGREVGLLSPQLAELTRLVGTLTVGSTRLGVGFSAAAIGLAAMVGSLVLLTSAGIKFTAQQDQINASLALTRSASGQTAESIEDISKKLSASGEVSTASVRDAAQALIAFKAVGRDAFQGVLEVAVQMSATGANVKDVATNIAKALTDQRNATDILKDSGLSLSNGVQLEVDRLNDQGKVAEAGALILKDLKSKTEGLTDSTDKATNAYTRFKDALDAIKNTAGSGVLKFLTPFFNNVADEATATTKSITSKGTLPVTTNNSMISPETEQRLANEQKERQAVDALNVEMEKLSKTAGMTALQLEIYNNTVAKGITSTAAVAEVTKTVTDNFSKNQFQATIEGLKQQSSAAEISAKTTGMSAGAAAAYTVAETARQKAIASGVPLSKEQNKLVEEYAAKIGGATAGAQKNTLAFQLDLETKKAHGKLTEEELQIIQRLEPIYGQNIPRALNSTEAAQMKLNSQIELGKNIVNDFANTFIQGMLNGEGAAKSLQSALGGLGSALAQLGTKNLVNSLGDQIGELAKGLGSFGGPLAQIGVGVGVSLISKLFGKDDNKAQEEQAKAAAKAAEELRKAQEAWAGMTRQLQQFNAAAAGLAQGTLGNAIDDLTDTAAGLMKAASAAHDFAGEAAIGATSMAGVGRLLREFARDLPGMIKDFGQSGPVEQAAQTVKDLMTKFQELNSSITEFASHTLSDQTVAFQQLNQAARDALLNTLDVPQTLSETGQAAADLQAKAAALPDALMQLGVSAADAATAINAKLTPALATLKTNFLDDITAQINDLIGAGFLNQANDLAKKVAQMRQDAAALGIQTSLIDDFYLESAAKIATSNNLTGASFDLLANQLGIAPTALQAFIDAMAMTVQAAQRSADQLASAAAALSVRLVQATNDTSTLAGALAVFDLQAQQERAAELAAGGQLITQLDATLAAERLQIIQRFNDQALAEQQRAADAALQAQKQAAAEQQRIWDEAVKFVATETKKIGDFISHFLAGATSTLSPQQQLAQAQSTFATNLALAQGGNRDALSGITGNAQDAIDAIRRYYGSSLAGQALITTMLGQLAALPAQISPEQFIVDAINSQTDTQSDEATARLNALNSVNTNTGSTNANTTNLGPISTNTANTKTSVDSTKNAVDVAKAAIDASNSLTNSTNSLITSSNSLLNSTNGILSSVNASTLFLAAIANNTTNIANSTGAGNLTSLLQSISTFLSQIASWAPGSNHAMGGYITGPGTSTSDSVFTRLSAGEGVIKASRMAELGGRDGINLINRGGFPGGANDNAAVVAEVRALRAEFIALARAVAVTGAATAENTAKVARNTEVKTKFDRRQGS